MKLKHDKKNIVTFYLFKADNLNIRTMWEICFWKLFMKIAQHCQLDIVLVSLLLFLNRFHNFFWCFYLWLRTSKCRLASYSVNKDFSLILKNYIKNMKLFVIHLHCQVWWKLKNWNYYYSAKQCLMYARVSTDLYFLV